MQLYTTAKVSPVGKVNAEDLKKWAMNMVWFTAPALFVLFYQLSQGASLKVASGLAVLALYGVLADLFKKFRDSK